MKGSLFESNSSENRARRDLVHDRCRAFSRSPSKGHFKKLKTIFQSCSDDLRIEYGFHCDYGNNIKFGERVYVNINCTILDGGNVNVGNDVLIGPNVQLITINHDLDSSCRLEKHSYVRDIKIGNNVWIGAGVIILPGAIIEDNVVIGAGSIVTGLLKSNRLYIGNPAKLNRKIG